MTSLPTSRFEGIALELREKIYQHLFTGLQLSLELRFHPKRCSDCRSIHDVLYTAKTVMPAQDYHAQRSLLSTNRRIRTEALPLFKASLQDLHISGRIPHQYHSLGLIPTCAKYCFMPSTLLRGNNIRSIVLGGWSDETFDTMRDTPEVSDVIFPELCRFPRLENIILLATQGEDPSTRHGATQRADLEQIRLGNLLNDQQIVVQVEKVLYNKLIVKRLRRIFDGLQRQSRHGVKIHIRQGVFIPNRDLDPDEKQKLRMHPRNLGRDMKVDIELRQIGGRVLQVIGARLVRGWSSVAIEDDSTIDHIFRLDLVEEPEVKGVGQDSQSNSWSVGGFRLLPLVAWFSMVAMLSRK